MSGGAVTLSCRAASMEDATLLWTWINDRETRRNSFNRAPVPYDDHVRWLEQRIFSATTRIWIFSDLERPVGQVRGDVDGHHVELHIAVAPECRGRGYGKAMLTEAVFLAYEAFGRLIALRARVLDRNTRSLKLFQACGFQKVGDDESPGGERTTIFEFAGARQPEVAKSSGDRLAR